METYIGQIILFAGNYAPEGWAFCHGQLLPILNNQALFSIIGTTYGGNGTTNFALPDLRGRVPIGMGQGPGLNPVTIGETGMLSTHGSGAKVYIGLNYCIALQGLYPTRT
jgi:microcystin-dependent protein